MRSQTKVPMYNCIKGNDIMYRWADMQMDRSTNRQEQKWTVLLVNEWAKYNFKLVKWLSHTNGQLYEWTVVQMDTAINGLLHE